MPFMVYDICDEPAQRRYALVRNEIKLAGRTGPLAELSRRINVDQRSPFGWHVTAEAILNFLENRSVGRAIVIDLKPRVTGNISLYRLLDVWGYSYDEWTPLALRLEVLFSDRIEADANGFKKSFVHTNDEPEYLGEFLYTQGGVTKGTWNWGLVGRVNGALLWRNAFDFLVSSLDHTIPKNCSYRERPSSPSGNL